MKICLVSCKLSSRLLKLKELIKRAIDAEVYYIIINRKCEVTFEEFDYIVLCSPFEKWAETYILESIKGKLIVDVNPEYEVTPLSSDIYYMFMSNDKIVDTYAVDLISHIVIDGLIDLPLFRQYFSTEKDKDSVIIDINFNTPDVVRSISNCNLELSVFSFEKSLDINAFEGLSFAKGIIGFELIDATVFNNCGCALYTTSDINLTTVIPNSMIDFALMGIPIAVDYSMEEARRFVLSNSCGFVVNKDSISTLKDQIKNYRQSNTNSIYKNIKQLETMTKLQSIFRS